MKFYESSEYQEKVGKLFDQVKREIYPMIPYVRFEHIGASSIKGSVSKGDLDIFIGVSNDMFQATLNTLLKAGFREKQDTLRTDELCMMITDKYNHDVALQVVVNGSEFEDFIMFRDFMITRPDLVEELNHLKRSSKGLDPDDYRQRKSEWVENIFKKYLPS